MEVRRPRVVIRGSRAASPGYKVDQSMVNHYGLEDNFDLEITPPGSRGWWHSVRTTVARWLEPEKRLAVDQNVNWMTAWARKIREGWADKIDPDEDEAYLAISRAVVNEDVHPELQPGVLGGEEEPEPVVEAHRQVFLISNKHAHKRKTKPDKVYRLAGVIANAIKMDLGPYLEDNCENNLLVQETARRKIQVLRKMSDPEFKNVRNVDAVGIAMQAALLYFIPDDAMYGALNMKRNKDMRRARRERNQIVKEVAPPRHTS